MIKDSNLPNKLEIDNQLKAKALKKAGSKIHNISNLLFKYDAAIQAYNKYTKLGIIGLRRNHYGKAKFYESELRKFIQTGEVTI